MTSTNKLVMGAMLLMVMVASGCVYTFPGAPIALIVQVVRGSRDTQRMSDEVDATMAHYRKELAAVRIGDSKNTVLSVLLPAQSRLRSELRKPPESYDEGERLVDIYYVRTNLVPDNRATDDEFTPYIFRDGVLVSIGWRVLGGPNTFGGLVSGQSDYSSDYWFGAFRSSRGRF